MSSDNDAEFAKRYKFKLAVTLEGTSNYTRWRSALQDQLFAKIRNPDMDRIVPTDTLDAKVLKTVFKDEWKAASKDAEGSAQDPLDDAVFAEQCFKYATKTANGFKPWIYDVFTSIRDSLCDDIKDQTAGVARGDVVALIAGIKLALGHLETSDPIDLEMEHSECKMDGKGGNDLMLYTAALSQYLQRLDAAGSAVPDVKAQRVLLRGLDEEIFESFIMDANRNKYASYSELEVAVKKFASQARVLAKLRALKPGVPHAAVLPTRAKQAVATDADGRMDRMESILATMVTAQGSKQVFGDCYNFRDNGKCDRPNCRFKHGGGGGGGGGASGNGNSNSRRREQRQEHPPNDTTTNNKGVWCVFHKKNTHNTADCHSLNVVHPELKAFYSQAVPGSQQINAARGMSEAAQYGQGLEQHRFENINVTRVSMPQHILAMSGAAKVDMWCVDGAATITATWDRTRCHDIRACKVNVDGPNTEDTGFVCTEMGATYISAFDKATGETVMILVHDVLINPAFPFHIFSEIKAFKAGATATKREGSWQFYAASGKPLLHASQRLLGTQGSGNVELYFIDAPPVPVVKVQQVQHSVKGVTDLTGAPRRGASQGRLAGADPRAAGACDGRAHHRSRASRRLDPSSSFCPR